MASLTRLEKNRLDRLKRRVEWLNKRVQKAKQNPEWRGDSYDEGELSALVWAIQFIEEAEDA